MTFMEVSGTLFETIFMPCSPTKCREYQKADLFADNTVCDSRISFTEKLICPVYLMIYFREIELHPCSLNKNKKKTKALVKIMSFAKPVYVLVQQESQIFCQKVELACC